MAKASKRQAPVTRRPLPPMETDPTLGLTQSQVQARLQAGWSNDPGEPPTKTEGQIIRENCLTFFNLIFLILAALLVVTGSYKNMMFLVIAIANTAIGTFQEIRSKRTVDKLTLVAERPVNALREGVFVGYRYYDAKKMPVRYPFGYGLSYTTFEYSGLTLDKKEMEDTDTLTVRVKVKNTGSRAGKETVQLYVRDCQSTMRRPDKELKGFAKVELAPGEEKEVVFTLDKRAFAYYSTRIQDWHVETGDFAILIGRSSRDIVLEDTVRVRSTRRLPVTFTMTSTVGDMLQYPEAVEMMQDILSAYKLGSNDDNADSENGTLGEGTAEMMEAMFRNMPVRSLLSFSGGTVDRAMLQEMLDKINAVLG